ncbi:hypothetical protein BKA65DRAFT_176588 [Rhexocercosporidium sp. MPI-PUGE-AT-0058]|nr:hypothetical protein BKA65DRAFT_176588 [Rhexocercosporidium sp. MPI-PUGE-AT-0058]
MPCYQKPIVKLSRTRVRRGQALLLLLGHSSAFLLLQLMCKMSPNSLARLVHWVAIPFFQLQFPGDPSYPTYHIRFFFSPMATEHWSGFFSASPLSLGQLIAINLTADGLSSALSRLDR